MPSLSTITNPKLKAFLAKAVERKLYSCKKINGFYVQKNRAANSGTFKYRPTDRSSNRNSITIGRTNKYTIEEAAQIALNMIAAISHGDDPRNALKNGSVKLKRIVKNKSDDPALLGNFLKNVYEPMRIRESGENGRLDVNNIKREFGHLFSRKMSELRIKDIRDWQEKKEKEGLHPDTIVRYYSTLTGLISRAIRVSYEVGGEYEGLLIDNPFPIRALNRISHKQRKALLEEQKRNDVIVRRMLQDDELRRLEKAMEIHAESVRQGRRNSRAHSNKRHLPCLDHVVFPHWVYPYIYFAYYTGLRPGDISDLRWEELDGAKLNRITNKSKHLAKPVAVSFGLTENKGVFKYSAKEVYEIWHKQAGNPKTGYVFPQVRNPKAPLSEKSYKKSWNAILQLTGVEEVSTDGDKHLVDDQSIVETKYRVPPLKLHMYGFRHNFISTLLRRGASVKVTATMAGHKTTQMVEERYSHHFDSELDEAADLMG